MKISKIFRKDKIKQFLAVSALCLGSTVYAQNADDGFVVPLNENFSNGGSSSGTAATSTKAAKTKSPLKQGIWIETQSDNVSLIRNISDGTKKGYEFDNSHFKTEANWWFWGDLNDTFHLDAEISVLNFDKTLYQANSYGANVPDVSWGDGLQTLAEMPFSLIKNGTDEGVGTFNKVAFNIDTPFVEARLGYGNLKENGMSNFQGIFTVIDRWDDVGNGYTELKNGSKIQDFGNFHIDVLAALSLMRDSYGTYDYLDVTYSDKFQIAATFGSTTTEQDLFFYNRTNTNAASVYLALTPIPQLKIEAHGLGTFGTDIDLDKTSMAGAGRISWNSDTWNVSLRQSIAGENVNSVWGAEGQVYDDINVDTATTQFDIWKDFSLDKFRVALGLDQGVTINDADNLSDGLIHLRTEPYADFNFSKLFGKEVSVGIYGVLDFDKLAKETSADREFITSFTEAGIEVKTGKLAEHLQNLTFDYAIQVNYDEWKSGNSYDTNMTYHSIIANAQLTDNFSLNAGSILRVVSESDPKNVPAGFALGVNFARTALPGHPQFWAHVTYGMNPYEDNNYSMFRADDPQNGNVHRTYLLNSLDSETTTSHISLGLIWNL